MFYQLFEDPFALRATIYKSLVNENKEGVVLITRVPPESCRLYWQLANDPTPSL